MKFKIKWSKTKTTFTVNLDDNETNLSNLQEKIILHLGSLGYQDISDNGLVLSLNNRDPLSVGTRGGDVSVSELGLVSGDILYIMGDSPPPEAKRRFPSPSAPAPDQASEEDTGHRKVDRQVEEMETETFKEEVKWLRPCDTAVETVVQALGSILTEMGFTRKTLVMKQNAAQPSTSQPSASQPSTSQPSASQPSTSQPSTSQPSMSACDETDKSSLSSPHLLRYQYLHQSCPVTTCCHLLVSPILTDCLLCNVLVSVDGVYVSDSLLPSTILTVSDFVLSKPADDGSMQRELQLPKLNLIFRDKLGLPALAAMQTASNVYQTQGIMTLPLEVLYVVLYYMPIQCVLSLANTCHLYHNLINTDQLLWMMFFRRDFTHKYHQHHNTPPHTRDWKQLYVTEYRARCAAQRASRDMRPPHPTPFDPYPHLPQPHTPFMPPGYLGGDWDRDPVFPGLGMPFRGGLHPRFDPMYPGGPRPRPGRPSPGRGRFF